MRTNAWMLPYQTVESPSRPSGVWNRYQPRQMGESQPSRSKASRSRRETCSDFTTPSTAATSTRPSRAASSSRGRAMAETVTTRSQRRLVHRAQPSVVCRTQRAIFNLHQLHTMGSYSVASTLIAGASRAGGPSGTPSIMPRGNNTEHWTNAMRLRRTAFRPGRVVRKRGFACGGLAVGANHDDEDYRGLSAAELPSARAFDSATAHRMKSANASGFPAVTGGEPIPSWAARASACSRALCPSTRCTTGG